MSGFSDLGGAATMTILITGASGYFCVLSREELGKAATEEAAGSGDEDSHGCGSTQVRESGHGAPDLWAGILPS